MIRHVFNALTVASALFLLALIVLAIPSFMDPEIEVVNDSPETVAVVASWRNHEKRLDGIQPGASREFTVDDEAAIRFRVRYAGGREIESEPLYFTKGIRVIAEVSDAGVAVRYDHE
jgi:hypothetical protein